MTKHIVKAEIMKRIDDIAKSIEQGRSVEIHPAAGGIKVYDVRKKVVRSENDNL